MFGHENGKGTIVVDGREVAHTHQCVHGGEHFEVVKGSGKRRGWCGRCGGPTCGAPVCDPCVPFEVQLEFMEGTLNAVNRKYVPEWLEVQRRRGVDVGKLFIK